MSRLPGVGLVQHLLGILRAKHRPPESWTSPDLGA